MKALIFILSNFGIMLAIAASITLLITTIFFPEVKAKKQQREKLLKEIDAAYHCVKMKNQ